MRFPGCGDASNLNAGVDQFFSVMNALIQSGRRPKRLTVDEVTWRIFTPEKLNQCSMRDVMSTLKEFRLGIGCCDDELPDREEEIVEEASFMIRNGVLKTWLGVASELRVLKLIMPMLAGGPAFLRTRDVIPEKTWPKLRELGLSDFETTEGDLVDLLLRHKESLRRLSLSHLDLVAGEWESAFRRIGGKLPKLRKIKLRGSFLESGAPHLHFGIPGEASQDDPMCDTIEECILYGGELPDFSDLLDEEIEWDDSEDGDSYDHESPSRIDEADAGYTSDGSVVSYSSDEFDKTI